MTHILLLYNANNFSDYLASSRMSPLPDDVIDNLHFFSLEQASGAQTLEYAHVVYHIRGTETCQ